MFLSPSLLRRHHLPPHLPTPPPPQATASSGWRDDVACSRSVLGYSDARNRFRCVITPPQPPPPPQPLPPARPPPPSATLVSRGGTGHSCFPPPPPSPSPSPTAVGESYTLLRPPPLLPPPPSCLPLIFFLNSPLPPHTYPFLLSSFLPPPFVSFTGLCVCSFPPLL